MTHDPAVGPKISTEVCEEDTRQPGKLAQCISIYGTILGQCTCNRANAGPIFLVCRVWKYRPPITIFQYWGRSVPDSLIHKETGAEEDAISTNHQLNISNFKGIFSKLFNYFYTDFS